MDTATSFICILFIYQYVKLFTYFNYRKQYLFINKNSEFRLCMLWSGVSAVWLQFYNRVCGAWVNVS
jgi:hypothetical protein